jgi:hypothetical protein
MGHACTHDEGPDPREHPVVAVIAIIAIAAAILLIALARIAVHGTEDIEAALAEPAAQEDPPLAPRLHLMKPDEEREVDAAVTSSRFATGFSP